MASFHLLCGVSRKEAIILSRDGVDVLENKGTEPGEKAGALHSILFPYFILFGIYLFIYLSVCLFIYFCFF